MGLLSAQDILKPRAGQFRELDVPQWGGSVRIRKISAEERDEWERGRMRTGRKGGIKADFSNFRARLCALCLVDAAGNRLFSETQVGLLGRQDADALDFVYEACVEHNGLDRDTADFTGGSSGSQTGDSSSSSA